MFLNDVSVPGSSRKDCLGFFIDGAQVGFVRPEIVQQFKRFPDVFEVVEKSAGGGDAGRPAGVHLSQSLTTPEERTAAVDTVLRKLRDKNELVALRGWYDEVILIMTLTIQKILKLVIIYIVCACLQYWQTKVGHRHPKIICRQVSQKPTFFLR